MLPKANNNIQVYSRTWLHQHISVFEIVVGDVICLKIGDQVPADGLFFDGHSLQVDKSSMIGKSDHVEVNCSHPFLVSGAKVVDAC
jgi:Ca2+-transporting ATPase